MCRCRSVPNSFSQQVIKVCSVALTTQNIRCAETYGPLSRIYVIRGMYERHRKDNSKRSLLV